MHKIEGLMDENAIITIYYSPFFRLVRNHKVVLALRPVVGPTRALLPGYFDCGTCGPLGDGVGAGAGVRCAGKPGMPFCN